MPQPSRAVTRVDREAVLAAAGPEIDALKREAKNAVRRLKTVMGVGVILPVLFFLSVFAPGLTLLAILGIFGVMAGMIAGGIIFSQRIFRARSKVMGALAPALGLSFEARAAAPLDLSPFRDTYYGSLFKAMRAEDVMRGERRGMAFQIFDAKLVGRSKGRDGEWRYGEPPKWLEGVAFHVTRVVRVETPGRWTGRTVVNRDFGVANRLYKPKGMERVGLVDSRFEKTFEVFATDQIEARAFLHPALMERLQELEDLFTQSDSPPVAVFEDGAFLIALPLARDEEESQKLTRGKLAALDDYVIDRIMWEIDAVLGVVDAVAGPDDGLGPAADG